MTIPWLAHETNLARDYIRTCQGSLVIRPERLLALIAIVCAAEDLAPYNELGDGDRLGKAIAAAKEVP